MSVPLSYLAVVLVWSTTPLTIAWSSESVDPVLAGGLRMAIAAVLGVLLLRLLRIKLPLHRRAQTTYAYASIGVFGAMCCTYIASRYVPSGLISIMFGLAPILSAVMGQWLLDEPRFRAYRWIACLLAFSGLGVIFTDDVALGPQSLPGLLLLLLAVSLFSLSGVMVKRSSAQINPLAHTVGALLWSLPGFAITWWLLGAAPLEIDPGSRSFWAIIYLALFGSLLGFVCYFHVLRHLPPSTVALVTLITPIFALMLGHWLNEEPLTPGLWQGCLLVVTGLALFFFGHRLQPERR
ncbi:MAG: DMT family transporter [Oceanospirillales bacterium]|uniref:Drug/metabolite transporter (DMT)-like permease n=1 Tax=Marinobacterium halophilum TaxID=267374 RepID=A0A2P8EQS3_9GAMM|nr:DMT family transporter [Marinobacterium halophilum]MBR9829410.1 DMT family transporter [Oceanospirillales bacterium]PSL11822.1 drug/metabolite transporter (DMT)-like permease [Marinobacterium halophilum]